MSELSEIIQSLANLAARVRQLESAEIPVVGGGGGGAPDDAAYLALALDADLTAERQFVDGVDLTGVDLGPNSTYTLNHDNTAVAPGAYGSATQSPTFTVNQRGHLTAAANVAISGVPPAAHAINGALHTGGTAILGTPGTLTVSSANAAADPHTHAITSSSNPAATASILASDASGYLQLVKLGVGTAPVAAVDIVSTALANALLMTDNTTNATLKYGSLGVRHYTNIEEPAGVFRAYSDATNNEITMGGGSVFHNAATIVGLYTAANNTTTIGTVRLTVNKNGGVSIGSAYTSIDPTDGYAIFSGKIGIGTSSIIATVDAVNSHATAYSASLTPGEAALLSTDAVGISNLNAGANFSSIAFINRAIEIASGRINFLREAAYCGAFTFAMRNDTTYLQDEVFRLGSSGLATHASTKITAGINNLLALTSLGGGANGDGGGILMSGRSSTTLATAMGLINWQWVSATHASRTAKVGISAYDTAVRLGLEIAADGVGVTTKTFGGQISKVTYVTDTYTVLASDYEVVCERATPFNATLPAGVVGQVFIIKNIGAGSVTVVFPAGDTLDGVDDDPILTQFDSMKIRCYVANKWIKTT